VKTKINSANMKRLASLSALGGALGMTAGPAQAGSILFSGVLDQQIGGSGGLSEYRFPQRGPGGILRLEECYVTCFTDNHWITLYGHNGPHGTAFKMEPAAEPLNALWGTVNLPPVDRGEIEDVSTRGHAFTEFNATDKYLLFEFTGGDLKYDVYGWASLRVVFGIGEPEVILVGWAYDLSRAQIPAGDTGIQGSLQIPASDPATPEPSTFVLTGLAALALGAKGLRAWRAARKSA
jgi:hypothetical protein